VTLTDPEVATAYHEAGHAVARFFTHGTTGPIIPAPLEGKEAGAEAEPLPGELLDGTELVPGPYTPEQRERLIAEIRTTLAGCVAEGMIVRRSALDVLEDAASSSDRAAVWGIAGRLWNNTDERDRRVDALCDEVETAMAMHWSKAERVARAYLERGELTAEEVRDLVGDD
jgi:hypothetical protein